MARECNAAGNLNPAVGACIREARLDTSSTPLIRDLSRGGREKPRKGDAKTRATEKRRRRSTAGSAKPKDLIKYLRRASKVAPVAGDQRDS
jgi:hypothetical protein